MWLLSRGEGQSQSMWGQEVTLAILSFSAPHPPEAAAAALRVGTLHRAPHRPPGLEQNNIGSFRPVCTSLVQFSPVILHGFRV